MLPNINEAYSAAFVKEVNFLIADSVRTIMRQPQPIFDALSHIGGLLVVFSLSFLIRYINEYQFNREIKHTVKKLAQSDLINQGARNSKLRGSVRIMPEEEVGHPRELFSFEGIMEDKARIQELERIVNRGARFERKATGNEEFRTERPEKLTDVS